MSAEWDEEERLAAERKKKRKVQKPLSRRTMHLSRKQVEDKEKFINFLLSAGYNARQLRPMKMSNLAELYYIEKKKKEKEEQLRKAEMEKALKYAAASGTKILYKGKEISREKLLKENKIAKETSSKKKISIPEQSQTPSFQRTSEFHGVEEQLVDTSMFKIKRNWRKGKKAVTKGWKDQN